MAVASGGCHHSRLFQPRGRVMRRAQEINRCQHSVPDDVTFGGLFASSSKWRSLLVRLGHDDGKPQVGGALSHWAPLSPTTTGGCPHSAPCAAGLRRLIMWTNVTPRPWQIEAHLSASPRGIIRAATGAGKRASCRLSHRKTLPTLTGDADRGERRRKILCASSPPRSSGRCGDEVVAATTSTPGTSTSRSSSPVTRAWPLLSPLHCPEVMGCRACTSWTAKSGRQPAPS